MGDVEADLCLADPPYGERTHAGQRHGRREAGGYGTGNWCTTQGIPYTGWTDDDVRAFVDFWHPRTRGWFCALTSHDLIASYQTALEAVGRYVFAPLSCVIRGMNVRLAGDGPSNWTVWLVVARPRSNDLWGTLPGAYIVDREPQAVIGGKPLELMRAIVRDYSRPGDLICDPCGGGFTTAIAAYMEGRRAITCEMDESTFAKGKARVDQMLAQGQLFGRPATREAVQSKLEIDP